MYQSQRSGTLCAMRKWVAAALCALALAGCADYTQAHDREINLQQAYEADRKPYPLTTPVIVGCDYFRLVGEKEHHTLGELATYMADSESFDWITGPRAWSERMCAS